VAERATDDVLARIDAAVQGRCAGPGCGSLITARSPSAYWCSEECYDAYHGRTDEEPEVPAPAPSVYRRARATIGLPRRRVWRARATIGERQDLAQPDPVWERIRSEVADARVRADRPMRIQVGWALRDDLLRTYGLLPRPDDFGEIGLLYGVPLIVDEGMPPNSWRVETRARARATIR
jgi:hypothetical protein